MQTTPLGSEDLRAATQTTRAVIEQFNEAFNRHDIERFMALMTDDCRFEDTEPAPDGTAYQGQAAVRAYWQQFFASSPHARFEFEELLATGNHCTVCWTYHWTEANGKSGHVRGVDVFLVSDGKVAEKRSYVKG